MRVAVLCVVIEIFASALDIDQSQYPNDENQIRRFKFSRYLALVPITIKHDQTRRYNGLSIGMLHPQQSNAFNYIASSIIPYLTGRASNIYKNEGLRRIPFIIERRINALVFTKNPKMLIKYFYPIIILYRFLPKKLFYKLQNENINYINGIRNLNLKLLPGKRFNIFKNKNKNHETKLNKIVNQFMTHTTKEPKSNQEAQQNSPNLSFNDKLHVLQNENNNKQIQNIAKSEAVNNIGVSGKNNQDNTKIIIKNLHVNVGANVSNIANNDIKESNKNTATANVTLMNRSRKINDTTKYSIDNDNNTLKGDNRSSKKKEDNQTTKSLSQSDKTTFSAKNNTTQNNKETHNTQYSNGKALDHVLPNDQYHNMDKQNNLTKKYSEFLNKGLEEENSNKYNIRNIKGYHNFNQISQGTGDMKKSEYNNESTNKKQSPENISTKIQNKEYHIGKIKDENDTISRKHLENSQDTDNLNIRDTVTQNLLPKNTNTIDEYNRRLYDEALEFEIEDLSESGIPQEITGHGNYNNKDKELSPSVLVLKLDSGKESDQKNVRMKGSRGYEDSMEVENINESNLHKIDNLQGTEDHFLINSMKPIEITKSHRVIVKETKTITFDQPQLLKNKYFTYNNEEPNLSQGKVYELFLLNVNDSPLVKNVIQTDYETSDQINIYDNNDKSNLLYVILNNIALSNSGNGKTHKRGMNKHITSFKSVKDQSDLSHEKEPKFFLEKDYIQDANQHKAKISCSDCIQNDSTQEIKALDGLLNEGYSTILNENVKMEGKNIENKSQSRNEKEITGYRDIKKESTHMIKKRDNTEEQDNTEFKSNVMTNKDKVIANILAPKDVKSDKKSLPYWLPSDAQEVYEILQQPAKEGAVDDNLDLEETLKEEIDKIIQLKKKLSNENLEEIVNLKINTVGIGKATNINDKLVPSLYDVYLKNFITKILYRLRQNLSYYEIKQQKNEIKNLDIHEIRKANSVLEIFESFRDVFNKHDDESLYELLVSLLRFHKNSEEDFDEEVKVILDTVNRKSIYGVLKHFLVSKPTLDAFRDNLKLQELYPQFVYFKVLEDILPNIKIIITNALAMTDDNRDDINKNADTMDKLVKILIILYKVMKDLGIPETTQRFIIEESILDVVRNLANTYIRNYEEIVYIKVKKQLQDALYTNINV